MMIQNHEAVLKFFKKPMGFSLLEMSFILIISGLFYTAVIKAYDYQQKIQKVEDTRTSLQQASAAIADFYGRNERYPCPARRTAAPGTAFYGLEFDANCDPTAIGLAPPGVGNPPNCANGVCLANGARDLEDAGTAIGDSVNELVVIGSFPYKFLNQTASSNVASAAALDGWNSQLTYAVTLSQTSLGTFKIFSGVIRAVDEFNQPTAGITNDAHYVLVSHGSDRKGAFTEEGILVQVCGTTTVDDENCDDDAVYAQALAHSEATNANYYDDYTYFSKSQTSALWVPMSATAADAGVTPQQSALPPYINNTNTNNVGVGTNNPQEKLHIAGTLNLSGHTDADNNSALLVSQICSYSHPTLCFPVTAITNTAAPQISCTTSGQVMTGIAGVQENCTLPVFAAPKRNVDCGAGHWVAGIRTNGDIICTP